MPPKKTAKGKASASKADDDVDLDALLNEMGVTPVEKPAEKTKAKAAVPAPAPSAPTMDAAPAEAKDDDDSDEEDKNAPKGSAADKKKQKKKEKKKAKKAEAADTEAVEEKPKEKETKGAAGKKPKGVAKAALEHLQRMKEIEEAERKAAEEIRRKEEEEERLAQEVEKKRLEEIQRIKDAKKAKKEELKRTGQWKTKAEREKARKAAEKRAALIQQGLISEDVLHGTGEETKKKKIVWTKKKGPKKAANNTTDTDNNNNKEQEDESNQHAREEEEEAEDHVEVEENGDEKADVESLSDEEASSSEGEPAEDWEAVDWEDSEAEKEKKRKAKEKKKKEQEEERKRKAEEAKKREEEAKKEAAKAKPEESSESESEEEEGDDSNELRSPICCILGHVDTGKTKLLDKIRRTNVQEGEAGGITQQIGATFFPMNKVKEQIVKLDAEMECRSPGLLIIDTPGHESFTNLRSRGSNLCDIAILVVDIMHGLEPQTLESLNLLRQRKTPFIIALNKIDRMFDWKANPWMPVRQTLKKQPKHSQQEFEERVQQTIFAFAEQGLNAALYYDNNDYRRNVSIVPTSAITGEGIPDLLMLIVQLTQTIMSTNLMYLSELQCTVLELKVIEGLGTTMDVILVNGVLHEGDTIVVCGLNGPIVTNIRALLTPQPMKELRIKGEYVHHKSVRAAMGVKICATDLEGAVAGAQLLVAKPGDDIEELKEDVMSDLTNLLGKVDRSGQGVCVQSSTLGSLEALLIFLKESKIPVSTINIGPIHKKDVMKASVMLEHKKEYATILAFDVKVTPDAARLAEDMGVRIFTADIIYHLFDQFTAYLDALKAEKKREMAQQAVFPCICRIVPTCIFNKKDPIVLGLDVVEGILRVGTPLCVPDKDSFEIGRVISIERDHKPVEMVKKGNSVAVKISSKDPTVMYGRHFDHTNALVSKISRDSIDALKEHFRDELGKEDWQLVIKLKKVFGIM
eukprot:GILJ01002490.1.p1 GENE.GILJ01002490.1~~GILJ01002490.1.p1  ORF type:complete len:972 (-),score=276.79 GILJ01002490.1:172-3087(-)